MSSNSKRKFKLKRKLPQILWIPSIEKWMPPRKSNSRYRTAISNLTNSKFEELAQNILHYRVFLLFHFEIQLALEDRTRAYVAELKNDILKLGHGAFAVDEKVLSDAVDKKIANIHSVASELWSPPNLIWFNNYKYRETFNRIVEYSRNRKNFSSLKLRREITYEFYQAVGMIKELFSIRYNKRSDRIKWWQFMESKLMSDIELSNFLRGGKLKEDSMSEKDFERSRNRFLKTYQKQRQ